jgi:hypothetical protein
MGLLNSSVTRVQPVFESLYRRDPSGRSWLLPLLKLGTRAALIPPELDPGFLLSPPAFEFPAAPPRRFLRFLLENPGLLAVPRESVWSKWSPETRRKRRAFLAGDASVRQEGLRCLEQANDLSRRLWWRFEGMTSVDCALFAQNAIVFIEGKRTEEGPSREVTWWSGRNQVIRNVECVLEQGRATGRANAFVILIVDEEHCTAGSSRARSAEAAASEESIRASLPHLGPAERTELMNHYLGWTSWQAIVRALGADDLPR